MDRGYAETLPAFNVLTSQARGLVLRHACQVEHRCSSRLKIRRRRIARPVIICDQTISLDGFYTQFSDYPGTSAVRHHASRTPSPARPLVFITNNFSLPAATICALIQKPSWQVELFFKWIKQHLRIKQFYGIRRRTRLKTQIWHCRLGLRPRRYISQEAPRPGRLALHFVTDPLGDPLRENAAYIKQLRELGKNTGIRDI